MTCRTVDNDAAIWKMDLVIEGVSAGMVDVPIKEVWEYADHEFRDGFCTRCGEAKRPSERLS